MPKMAKYPKSRVKSKRASIAYAFKNPDKFNFGYHDKHRHEFVNCGKLIDDYGYSANTKHNAKLWTFGNEYGYCHLVHCQDECDGHSAHLDESPTIAQNELHEAFGFYTMQAKLWHKTDNGEPWYLLCDTNFHKDIGEMVSESVLKCNGDRRTIGGAFDNEDDAIKFALEFIKENELDLIEGYEYQSNVSNTGIVNTGYNSHMLEIKWIDLVILPK